ncbi:major facilitator superfamily domain-containing protein, partial [Dactylonectria macrodidyma]
MAKGVIEPKHGRDVPGSVILDDRAAEHYPESGLDFSQLKHAKGRYSHIILSPQPSDDPNDPLNWPQSKKIMTMSTILICGIICAVVNGPLLAAGTVVIAQDIGVSIADISLLTGETLLVAGCCIPVSIFSRIWGKRPQFVFAVAINVVGAVIAIASFSTGSFAVLKAGRLIQGLSASAFESIIFSVIVDLFFVHERGAWIAATTVVLAGLSNLTPLIAGQITFRLGWHWNLYIYLIFSVIVLLLMFFFAPETTYERRTQDVTPPHPNSPQIQDEKVQVGHEERVQETSLAVSVHVKRTYSSSLAIFTGTYTKPSRALHMLCRLFLVLLNPVTWFLLATQAAITAFWVAVSYTLAQIYSPPPYLLDASQVGFMFAGPLVGAVVGCAFMVWADDTVAIWISRRNNGKYEPEFRLPLLIIALVMAPVGFFLMGWSVKVEARPIIGAVFYGIAAIGVSVSNAAGSSYLSDAYPSIALEAFIWASCTKNLLFYGFSKFINDWVTNHGAEEVFYTLGGLSAALILVGLPMYFFGKIIRDIWDRWDLL